MVFRFLFLLVVVLVGAASFFLGKLLGISDNWGEIALGGCVTALTVDLFYWWSGGWRRGRQQRRVPSRHS